jgi:ABC-type sugar transport system substrate-binding protein
LVKCVGQPIVSGSDQRDAIGEGRQPLGGTGQGIGVTIETDETKAGELGEEALGVATGAKGGVDQHGSGPVGRVTGERRGEEFDAALQQDRNVSVVGRVNHDGTSRWI